MPRAPLCDSLCRLSAYLEELEAAELKKFKLFLSAAPEAGAGGFPRGRLEAAGPLDTAQLLVARCGPAAAWPLALRLFQRIHRRDLWERGQAEGPATGKEAPPTGPLHGSRPRSRPRCGCVLCATPSLAPRSLREIPPYPETPRGNAFCASSFLRPGPPRPQPPWLAHPGCGVCPKR